LCCSRNFNLYIFIVINISNLLAVYRNAHYMRLSFLVLVICEFCLHY
jgi:hypothetical protein